MQYPMWGGWLRVVGSYFLHSSIIMLLKVIWLRIMYLRFVYSKLVDGMHSREGIFQAATEFVYTPLSAGEAVERAQEIRQWFGRNLDRPHRFCRSSSKGNYNRQTRGLSWFKPTAEEHISKAFELKSILDEHGFAIEVLKEKRLGYVVFEDTYQIVAEPFAETLT